jgi:lysylphosphatidylglycerol synthetase-like protein (DUF2156 family)
LPGQPVRYSAAIVIFNVAGAYPDVMIRSLKKYVPANVFLTAVLLAILLGLLFEGVMIGPEYQRYKPPYLIFLVVVIFSVMLFVLYWKERS